MSYFQWNVWDKQQESMAHIAEKKKPIETIPEVIQTMSLVGKDLKS